MLISRKAHVVNRIKLPFDYLMMNPSGFAPHAYLNQEKFHKIQFDFDLSPHIIGVCVFNYLAAPDSPNRKQLLQ